MSDNRQKVMIVEDDSLLAELLIASLRKANFETIFAPDAEEARKELDKQLLPDIILLDIILPGMNGFELLKIIKKEDRLKSIPVIVLSNLGSDQDKKKGMELGAVAYIVKANILPEDLIKKIKEVTQK